MKFLLLMNSYCTLLLLSTHTVHNVYHSVTYYRLKESDIGLVTFVAMMGAPIVILETLSGNDTKLALDALQRVLASGIYDTDKGWEEGGKKGNASLRVTEKDMGGGKNVSIAETNDLCNIDVSNVKMVSC